MDSSGSQFDSAELLGYVPGWRDKWTGSKADLTAVGLVPADFSWPGEADRGEAVFESNGLRVRVFCAQHKVPRQAHALDLNVWFVVREPYGLLPGYGPVLAAEHAQVDRVRCHRVDSGAVPLRDAGFRRFMHTLVKRTAA